MSWVMGGDEVLTPEMLAEAWRNYSVERSSDLDVAFLGLVDPATRNIAAALPHDPWFAVGHAPEMLPHTFRGTLRSVLGLEDDRKAFERYKAIRHEEREYL